MNEVDRHDLDALKELMLAKFDGVEATLNAMGEALHVAAGERSKKDAELNEVRQRFVDRNAFDQYKEATNRALQQRADVVDAQIDGLVAFKNRVTVFALIAVPLAGVIGAAVMKGLGG